MSATTQAQNNDGEWVPAIPEPFYLFRSCRCPRMDCRRRFRDKETYQGHFALVHILKLGRRDP